MKTSPMTRSLLCVLLVSLGSAATAQNAAPAKDKGVVMPATKTPAAKPGNRLMTRDELRACFKDQADNATENSAIEAEKASFAEERAALVAEKDGLLQRTSAMDARAKALMAELDQLKAEQTALATPPEAADMKSWEARRVAFNTRADTHSAMVERFNVDKRALDALRAPLDARIEANNLRGRNLKTRADGYNESVDSYKVNCLNKRYDVADEEIVKKEMQGAAPK